MSPRNRRRTTAREHNRELVEEEVTKAIEAILTPDSKYAFMAPHVPYARLRGRAERLFSATTGEYITTTAQLRVDAIVGKAEFIDDIVERINRKQLRVPQ